MYKVWISVLDWDAPRSYSEDIVLTNVYKLQEAIDWCSDNQERRMIYTIADVVKDGKQIDWRKELEKEQLTVKDAPKSVDLILAIEAYAKEQGVCFETALKMLDLMYFDGVQLKNEQCRSVNFM